MLDYRQLFATVLFGECFFCNIILNCFIPVAMDMPMELTALNVTPQGALLRWNPPLSNVDNYVLTLTHNQSKWT